MPKEAAPMPLGRSQGRSSHQQQVYGQSHQQPSSYHHLQQYHHLPRPPGHEYYSATAAYQNESQSASQAPPGPGAYEHALKMTAKYERSPYAPPQGGTYFKITGPYDHRPPSTQAQTSVQHKTSYERTSQSSTAGYNRGGQSVAAVQYDHKMSTYPPALPYDRFSKKKLATHTPEKTSNVGATYGSSRSDKKPSSTIYDRTVVPSSSYERVSSKVTVSSPMEVDKAAQNLSYERHKAYRASEYERRERHRRVTEGSERSEVQYERPYEAPTSAYERLGAAPTPIHTIASSYERQAPPTSSYERHSSVSAAYERRAVFDRAYEAAAYERRLFPPTSAFSSLNHAYYTATTNVSEAANAIYPSSMMAHVSSTNLHTPSMISHHNNQYSTSSLPANCLNHSFSHNPVPISHSQSNPVFTLSPFDSSMASLYNEIAMLTSTIVQVPSTIPHNPNLISHSSATTPVNLTIVPNMNSVPSVISHGPTAIPPFPAVSLDSTILSFTPTLIQASGTMVAFSVVAQVSNSNDRRASTGLYDVSSTVPSMFLPVPSSMLQDPNQITHSSATTPVNLRLVEHVPSLTDTTPMSNMFDEVASLVSNMNSRVPIPITQFPVVSLDSSTRSSPSLVQASDTMIASTVVAQVPNSNDTSSTDFYDTNSPLPSSNPTLMSHSSTSNASSSLPVIQNHSSQTPFRNICFPDSPESLKKPATFYPDPCIRFLAPASTGSYPCPTGCICYTSAWHYPYPSYGPNCTALAQAVLYSRGQERQVSAEEFEAKDVPSSSIYPAKPRMSLLTSPEYLSSMRRSQQAEDNARCGQASVIVPPSRSPADSSASRKRLRDGCKPEPLPPLTIDTTCSPKPDPEKHSIYMPTVEPISPTSPPEAVGDDGADAVTGAAPKSSAKDSLLLDISRVDREINKIEHHIFSLKRKQVELEQKAKKSIKTEPKDEAVEAPLPQHFSLSHKIYSENRRKAKEAHAALCHLGPPVDLPLYNQPTDMPVYQENRRKHQLFKGRLIAHLRRKRREKCCAEMKMMEDYARRTDTWHRLVEKMESSPERKRRDAENRELFEKTFPKIRKEREDRERFLRVGSRVKSDADLEEIMDNLHEQEMEVKKMRDYAAVPPMLLSANCRRCVYVSTNGLIEDFSSEYKDRRLVNIWTDTEKEIFREKFLTYPKNFGAIAAFLERKSVSDCVQYYYLSKKTENYKLLLKKSGHKSKSGRNKSKAVAPPVEPAQLSTLPAPSIAPRFQRDYKPEGSSGGMTDPMAPTLEPPLAPATPQVPPASPPLEPENHPVVKIETPPASVEVPPPPDLSEPKSATVVTTSPTAPIVAAPRPTPIVAAPRPTPIVAAPRPTPIVAAPRPTPIIASPPILKPLILPFPDIPIVVIDDSDDSNSSSHFPSMRK